MFIHISRGWSFLHLQIHKHIWWPLPEKHTKMQRTFWNLRRQNQKHPGSDTDT